MARLTGMAAVPDLSRYRAALAGEPLPAAIVDLDALDANVDAILRASEPKPLRVATKSIRCPAIVERIVRRGASRIRGLMTYTAAETAYLAGEGYEDLLLAYPTMHPDDARLLAEANAKCRAAVVVDSAEHLAPLDAAARAAGTRVPVVVDMDVSYRPGGAMHLGVRRSPLHTAADVVGLARRVASFAHLTFAGVMAYEAQIAGVQDSMGARAMKSLSRRDVATRREEVRRALDAAGLSPSLFNGGGTGSLASSAKEAALTEVTAGSGFLDSHLFDWLSCRPRSGKAGDVPSRGLALTPAAYFALQVVRVPAPGMVTCHGGGYVASGAAGKDRLPIPALPPGLSLLALEGAGEVQTPLAVPADVTLAPGDLVLFRHAKAGELAEHFREYLLVEGNRVVGRAPTYRGLGLCFLG